MAARKRVGELDMAFGRLLITPRSAVTEIEGQYCQGPAPPRNKKMQAALSQALPFCPAQQNTSRTFDRPTPGHFFARMTPMGAQRQKFSHARGRSGGAWDSPHDQKKGAWSWLYVAGA